MLCIRSIRGSMLLRRMREEGKCFPMIERHGLVKTDGIYSNLVHMALSTPLMQRITDIALSDQVGVANTSANVRWTRTFCLRIIQRQVRSLEYIARHCKSLQVLSISMHPIVLQEVHQRQLESISTALLNIFNECKDLRRIELKVHQHKPRCGCYNEYFADQTQHGPAKEPLLQESLDLVSHESVDADTASAWASSVLRDMRRDERLVMVCPYATAWIPEQGRRIMLSTGAVHSIPRRS